MNPLSNLLALFKQPHAIATPADFESWPAGLAKACIDDGLLEPAGEATFIACPNCEMPHNIEAVSIWPDGVHRLIGTCEYTGVVRIAPHLIKQWRLCVPGLIRMIQRGLSIAESNTPSTPRSIGYLVLREEACHVVLCDGDAGSTSWPQEKRIVISPSPVDVPCLSNVMLADIMSWTNVDIAFNIDPIVHALKANGEAIEDGSLPDVGVINNTTVIYRGRRHACESLSSTEMKLTKRLIVRSKTSMRTLVNLSRAAVWQQEWDPHNQAMRRKVTSMLNRVNKKLADASPPVPTRFSIRSKAEMIIRGDPA